MSLAFESAGSKATNPLVADGDPNAFAPLVARIVQLPERTVNGRVSRDARVHVDFTSPVGTPAIDLVPWVFDETASVWIQLPKLAGLEDKDFRVIEAVAPGRMFFQVVDFAGGSADSAEVFVAPL